MRTGKLTVSSRLGTRKISRNCWLRLSRSAAASNCATATAYGLSTSGSLIATKSSPLDSWPALAWGKRSTVASGRQHAKGRHVAFVRACVIPHPLIDILHRQDAGPYHRSPDSQLSSVIDGTRQPGDRAYKMPLASASP